MMSVWVLRRMGLGKRVKFRAWVCFCDWWYTGADRVTFHAEEPDRDRCHRASDCGWSRVSFRGEAK
jgi:hypothetical protein